MLLIMNVRHIGEEQEIMKIRIESECFTQDWDKHPLYTAKFSKKAMVKMVAKLPGKLVTLDFNNEIIIGEIISAKIINDKAIIQADIEEKFINCGRNIVPAYNVIKATSKKNNKGVERITYYDVDPICCGLTLNPSEKDRLKPLKIVSNKQMKQT